MSKRMSDAKWADCTDPSQMLRSLEGRVSNRKLRLIACAACRKVWNQIADPDSRAAVEIAERFADGNATIAELKAAHKRACAAFGRSGYDQVAGSAAAVVHHACYEDISDSLQSCVECTISVSVDQAAIDVDGGKMPGVPNWESLVHKREKVAMARLIREIVGGTVRPIQFASEWRSAEVQKLANAFYENRDFSNMSGLANPLIAGGCEETTLLSHCRDPRPHFRGCWLIDLILGKD